MKTFRLSKKLKTLLWTSSALVLNTVIASSLTSCSLFKKDVINDIGGYDKQYGITRATYDKMESDFKEIYETDLETKHKQGEINDDEHESNLLSFRSRLNNLHNTLYGGCKTCSYTTKTSVLKDFAKDNYEIRLARYTGANLDNEISQIKNSMLMNLTMMIKQYEIDIHTTSDIITNATTKFAEHEKHVREDLKDDIVTAVQYLQNNMIECFDGICKEISLSATQKQLESFFKNVEITVKDEVKKGKPSYYWDDLYISYGPNNTNGNDINRKAMSTKDFNNIFDIKVENFIPNLNFNLKTEQDKMIDFSEDIITGYTLQPVVYDMPENPYKNEYSIGIDFTLVNNRYVNDLDKDKLTAHSASPDSSIYKYNENEDIDPFKINDTNLNRKPLYYELPITNKFEKSQLMKTYFNTNNGNENNCINITWSKSDDYGFNDFWSKESNGEGGYKGNLDLIGLANAGMVIDNTPLTKLLDTVGKIYLNHGDNINFSLSGTEGVAGQDSVKWSLFVDGKEVPNDFNLKWELKSTSKTSLPNELSISDGIIKWSDEIEAGTYTFNAIAKFKEVSLQSKDITLTISKKNSELTNSIKYINYSTNNLTNDDKKGITDISFDFITFVDFNLDYDEYDLGDNGVEKNEIKIRNFNVSYKHHALGDDHSFDVPEMIKNNIYNQINKDGDDYSGITNRISNNCYNELNFSYQAALSGKIIREMDLYIDIKDEKTTIDSFYDFCAVISVIFDVFELLAIAALIIFSIYKWKKNQIGKKTCYLIATGIELLLCIIAFGVAVACSYKCHTTVKDYMDGIAKYIHPDDKDENKGTIDNETPFAKRLIDDNKYFLTPVDKSKETSDAKELFYRDYQTTKQIKEIWNYYHNYLKQPSGYQKKDNWDDEKEANKQFINEPYYQYREYDKFYDKIQSETIKIADLIKTILILAFLMVIVYIVIVCVAIYMWKRGFFNIVQDIPVNEEVRPIQDLNNQVKNSANIVNENGINMKGDNDSIWNGSEDSMIEFNDGEIEEINSNDEAQVDRIIKIVKESKNEILCKNVGFDFLTSDEIKQAMEKGDLKICKSNELLVIGNKLDNYDPGKNMIFRGYKEILDTNGNRKGYIYFYSKNTGLYKYKDVINGNISGNSWINIDDKYGHRTINKL
ncbi:MAG: hypothetical protein J6Y96_01550 [Mycoplasma sp.]|nr:hypothetical protein [Mycoplasma sp.]